jgi:acyl-CoA synthetase (NDP forming)
MRYLIRFWFMLLALCVSAAALAQADIEVNTPGVMAIKQSMRARYAQLADFYASGAVGQTADGLVALRDANAVRDAYRDLSRRLASAMTGVIVQSMISGGVEVMVGVSQDATFGPLIAYGSGGTLVELVSDVAFRLHPLTDRDVTEMIDEVRGSALLRGFRGAPLADEASLRDLILRVSALVEACPEVREMDLNPVKVLVKGASVVDARVRVERPSPPPVSRRIAY